MTKYITHASTLSELRAEFLSDIERRINQNQSALRFLRPNATEAARIARVVRELQELQDYWAAVDLVGDTTQKSER